MPKIGTYILRNEDMSTRDKLRATREAGFDFVCVGMGMLDTPEHARALLEDCAALGLFVENAHLDCGGAHDLWREGEAGDIVARRYCEQIALCAGYGVKTVIAHVTWGIKTPPEPCPLGLDRLRRAAECAQQYDVTLALENSVTEKHLRYALDALALPAVGYCFDSGHKNAFAPGADYLGLYGARLAALHLQDNDGANDLHLMPLDGCVDWQKTARDLAKTPFAREKICAEVAALVHRDRPGESAEQIRASLARVAILDDARLMDVYEGGFTAYARLTYAEKLSRLYAALRKIADALDKAAIA